jgi:sugar phosphate isomerase/epimerase
MKIGVVSNALLQFDFEEGLDVLRRLGLERIEIACAGYHENLRFGDPAVLADASERARWQEAIAARGLEISALAVHGPALSPDPEVFERYKQELRRSCELAAAIGVDRLTLLGGLPEGAPGDRTPHWVCNAWPPQEQEILKWQWEERVIPYWREQASVADAHGCRLCFEMHPMDVLHNPAALLRLNAEIGPTIGCNFDPSHLWWQGIDPLEAMRAVAPLIYHVHAKDTQVMDHVVRVNGVLDAKPFSELDKRGWDFRTVGYGHGETFWRDFVSLLRALDYDDVVSIEHEDEYMDPLEGLEKAVGLLERVVLERPRVSSWDLISAAGEGS